MNTQNTKTFTSDQLAIVNELCSVHGLDPSQISFEGEALNPIFDYEAVCALSLKLTDIKSIDCEVKRTDPMRHTLSIAVCTVVLPDGRTRTVEDSAELGEKLGNGETIETQRDADNMAQNRAVRRGIRSVGVNLWNAHKAFMKTGEPTSGTTNFDPRKKLNDEIHALAAELGFTKEQYQDLLASGYDGRTSTLDLNDIERQNFARLLRSLRRVQKSRESYTAAAA